MSERIKCIAYKDNLQECELYPDCEDCSGNITDMTREELTVLLDKVKADIDNYSSYHIWYSASSEETWDEKGGYVTFEVFGYSDQCEGSNWTEHWSINNNGTIVRDGEVYENYNEFKNNWT